MDDLAAEINRLDGAGVQPKFIFAASCFIVLMVIGLVGNLCIVFTLKTNRKLNGISNYLISINALGDIGHQMSHLSLVYYVFSGKNVTTSLHCFYLMAFSFFCMDFTLCIMIWIGIDRILVILLGARYGHLNKKLYLTVVCLTSSIYGTVLLFFAYHDTMMHPNRKTICIVVSIFGGYSQKIWLYSQICVVAFSVLTYVAFWTLIKKYNCLNDKHNRQILLCVSIVMGLVVVCWELATIIMSIAEAHHVDGATMALFIMHCGLLVNISCCANYFLYYRFSTVYCLAFKKQINWMLCRTQNMKTFQISPSTRVLSNKSNSNH